MGKVKGRELQTLRLFATLGFLTLLAVLLMKVVLFGPSTDKLKNAFQEPRAAIGLEETFNPLGTALPDSSEEPKKSPEN